MYTLTLDPEEQKVLIDLLECAISELHDEIHHTDHRPFKELLKERKEILSKLLTSLTAVQQTG